MGIEILIVSALVVVIGYSFVARVDIVVRAPAVFVPVEQSRALSAIRPGVIRRFHVREGEIVEAGQRLVTLEDPGLDSEMKQKQERLDILGMEMIVVDALLKGTSMASMEADFRKRGLGRHEDYTSYVSYFETERRVDAATRQEYTADYVRISADIEALESDLRGEETQMDLADERRASVERLAVSGSVARVDVIESRLAHLDLERALQSNRAGLKARQKELRLRVANHEHLLADTENDRRKRQIELVALRTELKADLRRIRQSQGELELFAPVAGRVQELKISRLNQPTVDEPLLVLVPTSKRLEIVARLASRDVGFVAEGQSATVLLDAFSLVRFGALDAEVLTVSLDTTLGGGDVPVPPDLTDARRLEQDIVATQVQPTYLVRLLVENVRASIALRPGLSGIVNIKTGERRVVDFFLDPLFRAWNSAMGER